MQTFLKQMERSSTIGYVLILVLFIGYFYFNKQTLEEIEAEEAAQEQVDSTVQEPAVVEDTLAEIVPITLEVKADAKSYTLENELLSLSISNYGGKPEKAVLKKFDRYDSSELVLFDKGDQKYEFVIPLANGEIINSSDLIFQPVNSPKDNSLLLEAKIDAQRSIIQSYKLNEGKYLVTYDVEFKGFADVISPKNRYVELQWGTRVLQQEKSLEEERNNTTVYYKYTSESGVDYLDETSEDDEKLEADVQWLSFKQKFFNQTLIKRDGFVEDGFKIEVKEAQSDAYVEDLSANLFLELDSRDNEKYAWELYFGPNHYQTLKKLDVGAQKIIPLGWGIFGWVNKGLVIPVFNWLEQYFSNYGLIILCLTILIKLILAIPMFKVYQSSAKMRILKPELDAIKEKTGGDMQKMQQEQMKLYKQAGVSPLGGCLPQLIQLPILFAMFRFFPSSIELRQEKLWWADDLSTYDSIWDFPGGFDIPFYGDHVSLFTLMMTVVTVFYTYMNSQNTAGMTGPMKYVMYLMPIMFLGFFNNYSAALSFYYFLSTCITIIQNVVIRRFFIDEDKLHRQLQENKKKKVKVKKSGLQKRLEDMAKKQGVDPYKRPANKKRK